jgi:hypothetical protein
MEDFDSLFPCDFDVWWLSSVATDINPFRPLFKKSLMSSVLSVQITVCFLHSHNRQILVPTLCFFVAWSQSLPGGSFFYSFICSLDALSSVAPDENLTPISRHLLASLFLPVSSWVQPGALSSWFTQVYSSIRCSFLFLSCPVGLLLCCSDENIVVAVSWTNILLREDVSLQ